MSRDNNLKLLSVCDRVADCRDQLLLVAERMGASTGATAAEKAADVAASLETVERALRRLVHSLGGV